ncbi:class I SAM-dependent methyltransferase [Yeosuana sp.]|uniref:class I SAM-dependent methyltransferase n=1 Tax=Yeosuana sp. TaxID=2529388 RepID=UPI004054E794
MGIKLEEFWLNQDINVFFADGNQQSSFKYSDGDKTEERIYNIIKNARDLSIFSDELIEQIYDWPTEYHFSPLRHNLLRHFEFKSTDRILELGCGCGAITRQLGESGAAITAIEGSKQRAKCASSRTRDLPNVNVYCSDFQKISFDNQFNYVTLIGVLEYSTIFFSEEDPLKACLEIIKSALKPDGKLIIAIENRLGLKYFMGYSEDHGGAPFSGIQDLYTNETAKTLGKEELLVLLKQSNFENINFQYPFPDYKIPEVLFFESAFKSEKFSPSDIICQMTSRDYSRKTIPLFSENLVWPIIDSNKLISQLSNSFLVVASLNKQKEIDEQKVLGIKYTVDRKIEYNTRTEFIENDENNIIVKKKNIIISLVNNKEIKQELVTDDYYHGVNLDVQINKAIKSNNFAKFIDNINLWINYIKTNAVKEYNSDNIYYSRVLPNYIDCIPRNLIITQEGLKYIDREWVLTKEFTLFTLIMRYINMIDPDFIDLHIKGLNQNSYDKLLNYLGIPFNHVLLKEVVAVQEIIEQTFSKYRKQDRIFNHNSKQKRIIAKILNKLPSSVKDMIVRVKRVFDNMYL